ncbi:hypothetical protein HF086_011824 [Spodoptera exigua]|uniref:Uncharacterized protein n=1 Tax=Spodoptera exigua TaxID=7107 RepID=A0A922MY99_SPOEX|nr:hypothetical protein HF086_011824 [Spodoptera exigua]
MMANNRIPSGPNTPGSQQTPTQQGIKIFIQRDYSEGTAVKFQTRFPPELEDRHLRKVSKFIATQNERVYNPRGIHITDPILRGLRVIEITVIDVPNCQSPTGNSNNQMRHT